MDLDLVLVRSFVATAEELHFRHAADRLFITQFLATLKRHQPLVGVSAAEVSSEYMAAVRSIPLTDPTPVYPWSLVWRADEPHPLISRLLDFAEETAVDYVPGQHWLPGPTTV